MRSSRTILAAWSCGVLGAGALLAFAAPAYAGSPITFAFFSVSYLALIGLAVPKPRVYGYTFIAALLFLGFWFKVMVHLNWVAGFLEPTGNFAGAPQAWDDALRAASCGAIGVMLPRVAQLFAARRSGAQANIDYAAVPAWYGRWRLPLWSLTLIAIVVLNVLNLRFAFYQVGVNPKLIMPMHLNVAAAWLITTGLGLCVATLVFWDMEARQGLLARNLLAPIVEGLLCAVSSMSRLLYLLHLLPYWVVIAEKWDALRALLGRRACMLLAGTFLCVFCVSILAVFWLRLADYYPVPVAERQETVPHEVQRTLQKQLPQLAAQRWVGLEGVLAVASLPERNLALMVAAIRDNPKLGSDTLYQRTAKPWFLSTDPGRLTFLSNAGPIAIFFFSGSLIVILLGMSLITAVVLAMERFAQRWTGNPFLLAVAAAGVANVVVQTTFPYLTLVYVAQMLMAIGLLGFVQRTGSAGGRAN